MKKVENEILKKIKKEKNEVYHSFLQDKLSLEQLAEKLALIKKLEELIKENTKEEILLDKREIRELARKTLYISFPREITEYGWNKSTEVKITIEKDGEKIILEKVE